MSTAVKAYRGMGMEGLTAHWYASLTRNSMDEFRTLAARVAQTLPPGSRVLEVAPGPGYFSLELARRGSFQVTGIDISQTLVKIARRNASEAGLDVTFRHGNAADMPLAGKSFDFLLCRAAFKNFTQPVEALREMYRVLRPGGRAWIIDLRKDTSLEDIGQAVDSMGVGRVNRFLTKQTFRFVLLKRAYTRAQFEGFLAQTKFRTDGIQDDLIGLELHLERPSAGSRCLDQLAAAGS